MSNTTNVNATNEVINDAKEIVTKKIVTKKPTSKKDKVVKEKKEIVADEKQVSKLQTINLSKFADALSKVENKPLRGVRNGLYVYPDSFTKEKINSIEGKQFRNKKRKTLLNFVDNLSIVAKQLEIKQKAKSKDTAAEIAQYFEICNKFKTYYKETYCLNDFSLNSVSQSNNEDNKQSILLFLNLVKETI